ncbi:MAG: Lrp/AsnC family transcriptional regulator, partial [Candidatus Bathyarchaeia archaeon]
MNGTNVRGSAPEEKGSEKRVRKGEELNETDVKILKALTLDARLSLRQLAKQCNVSTSTALLRVKKLEEAGIIKGYTALVDHEK